MGLTRVRSPRESRDVTRFENRREREFYRYYEPIRSLTKSGPPLCNLHDGAAIESHVAISSPDRALTAFCQLGALRMGTRRALLFFFDSKYAYVLAEATRTLSLQDDSVHEIEDALWLGHSIIPRGFSVCEETVCRAPAGSDQMHPLLRAPSVHVITDLEADATFCDRPFVLDGPKARFYAGVPITTPKGINIGAYCCLDDKTRPEGIGPKDIQFLHDMAATVMTHLETVRAKSEFERGTQMVTGLSAYVEGASSARKGQIRIPRRIANKPSVPMPHVDPVQVNSHQGATEDEPTDIRGSPHLPLPVTTSQPDLLGSLSGIPEETGVIPNASIPASYNEPTLPIRSIRQSKDLREQLVTPTVRHSFERAAHLVREAVDVHGVMFLDTTVGTFGGLVHSDASIVSGTGSDGASFGSESMLSENETPVGPTTGTATASNKACHVLAQSFVQPATFNDAKDYQVHIMTDKFLRSLLRRFPRGKVWNFSQVGDASSDEESLDASMLDNSDEERNIGTLPDFGRGVPAARTSKRVRNNDSREIRRLFPGVRSLAVIGLWNQNRGKWYAACVVWTYSPLRIFSPESELNFVSAWCDVIMAEVDRLEALDADRTKGDFISSISHELRSPLHGILGSVECLQEHLKDPLSITLASQVEICGRTLLDVIDHVLEYSKIGAKSAKGSALDRREQDTSSDPSRSPRIESMGDTDAKVVLDEITEDVIQSSVYSFGYKPSQFVVSDRKVAVVLDIERSSDFSWNCHIPLGAWKRICINVVGNALKYTDRGVIHVSLKAHPIPGRKRWFHAVFTVRDTGRGMSKIFLQNHLFKAFTQEDTLVEGTGLGMNLVAKIVKSLDGRIDVVSEKGVGTTVSVKIPIEAKRPRIRDNGSHVDSAEAIGDAAELGSELAVEDSPRPAVLLLSKFAPHDESDLTVEARQLLLKSIGMICSIFARSALQSSDILASHQHDVSIILDSDLAWYIAGSTEPTEGKDTDAVITAKALAHPIVIVCDSAVSERDVRARMRLLNFVHVDCIVQPCTRKNVASAVHNCFSHKLMKQQASGESSASNEATTCSETITSRPSASLTAYKVNVPDLEADSVSWTTINENESDLRQPKPENTQPVKPDVEQNAQPAKDYFLGRSLSTGHSPASPHALTPLPHIDRTEERRPGTSTAAPASSAIVNHGKLGAGHRTSPKLPAPSKSSLSLLLVDDNSINLQLLVTYATKRGHPRITASDGAQAVEAYKSAWSKCLDGGIEPSTMKPPPPAIILMDINMPVMNGFEATRQIRAFEQQNGLSPAHVIALTGLSSPIAQQEAFSSGVDLFLTKPVRLKELTKLLQNIHAAGPVMNAETGS